MKNKWGKSFLLIAVVLVTAFFSYSGLSASRPTGAQDDVNKIASASPIVGEATLIGAIPGHVPVFETFGETGIFIMRDEARVHGNDVYRGTIAINQDSQTVRGVNLNSFSLFRYSVHREVVDIWGFSSWVSTDFLFLAGDAGMGILTSQRTVTYSLFQNAPAGRYSIHVYAYVNTTTRARDWMGNFVSSRYIVVHGEPLTSITLRNARTGHAVHHINRPGHGLNTSIYVSVMANHGAISRTCINNARRPGHVPGDLVVGVLRPSTFVELSSVGLEWQIENANGAVVANVFNFVENRSVLVGRLPSNLGNGVFIVRAWHQSNADIVGVFIIDNTRTAGGGMDEAMATLLIMFGLILGLTGAVMFSAPRLIVYFQHSAADRAEERRLKQAGVVDRKTREKESKTAYERVKMITKELEENKDMSEAKKQALLEEREAEYQKTKTGGFLRKLNTSKMKRELARESGMSMEDFKELYGKQEKMVEARTKGFSDVRRDVEVETGDIVVDAITQREEEESAPKVEKRLAFGEAEFELLDSVKYEADIRESTGLETDINEVVKVNEQAREATSQDSGEGGSILEKLRKLTEED